MEIKVKYDIPMLHTGHGNGSHGHGHGGHGHGGHGHVYREFTGKKGIFMLEKYQYR